jgi:hypothetical protein
MSEIISIEKSIINTLIIKKLFKEHTLIKENLLKIIQSCKDESLKSKDEYYSDNIEKLDWSESRNFKREWVNYIINPLLKNLTEMISSMGFETYNITEIWFQQYIKNSEHGWHIHGSNYTGVYYVELNENSPQTEIMNPEDLTKKQKLNVKEGDIIIFPSFVIHKAPLLINDYRKTIVSFNINFEKINPKYF